MADFTTSKIKLNERDLDKLIVVYKRSLAEIIQTIDGIDAFDAAHRRQVLTQIVRILTDYGVDVNQFIRDELPVQYRHGADEAVRQLREIHAKVRVGAGFSRIHQRAVIAMIDETSKAFAEGLQGVKRSASVILNKAVKEEIKLRLAGGQVKGDALIATRRYIKGLLREEGLTALIDRGGRKWELDRYADMLIRTKAVEARNVGLINRMVENDYDLVQVSAHGAVDVCEPWERKILSLTGKTPGYKTISDAEDAGLLHPNCKHTLNVINLELARKTMGWNTDTQKYEKGIIR